MFKEFKEFAVRGNVMDMAIGIVLGTAFGKIVSSLVADVLMPLLGVVMGDVDFSQRFINLGNGQYPTLEAARAVGAPTLNYGVFVTAVVDFLFIALAIFVVVKIINAAKREPVLPPAEPDTKPCHRCLSEIPLAATRCAHCTTDV